MEAPSGSEPGSDGAGDCAHPDPRTPGATAPSSGPGPGPCSAARESERQLRLRLCVLNEILGTERDYVGTLRFLQSVSVARERGDSFPSSRSPRCVPHNLWPWSLWVESSLGGAPRGARKARGIQAPPGLLSRLLLPWAAHGPAPTGALPHSTYPRRALPFCLFFPLLAFQIVLKLVTSAMQGLGDPGPGSWCSCVFFPGLTSRPVQHSSRTDRRSPRAQCPCALME